MRNPDGVLFADEIHDFLLKLSGNNHVCIRLGGTTCIEYMYGILVALLYYYC